MNAAQRHERRFDVGRMVSVVSGKHAGRAGRITSRGDRLGLDGAGDWPDWCIDFEDAENEYDFGPCSEDELVPYTVPPEARPESVGALMRGSRVKRQRRGARGRLVAVDQGGSTAARPLWVCRHEAAHAVVAHELGDHVFGLLVSRHGGMTNHGPRSMRPDPLRQAMITVAGHAADVLWSRHSPRYAPYHDHLCLKQMGFQKASYPALLALAQDECIVHESKIRAVAAALKKGNLDRRSFLRALRSAPTVAKLGASKGGVRG